MKRGAKSARLNRIMSMRAIAQALDISEDTVRRALKSGVRKLKQQGAFSIVLAAVRAVDADSLDPLQASSAECRKAWVERFARQ